MCVWVMVEAGGVHVEALSCHVFGFTALSFVVLWLVAAGLSG